MGCEPFRVSQNAENEIISNISTHYNIKAFMLIMYENITTEMFGLRAIICFLFIKNQKNTKRYNDIFIIYNNHPWNNNINKMHMIHLQCVVPLQNILFNQLFININLKNEIKGKTKIKCLKNNTGNKWVMK